MKTLVRGQRARLSDIVGGTRFKVGFKTVGSRGGFDISCFVLGVDEKILAESYIVFYNQRRSPCGGVALLGAEGEDSETLLLDLAALPPEASRIVFAVTMDGLSIADIPFGHVHFLADGVETARYEFVGDDFIGETALLVAELYRKDVWRLCIVGQGFVGRGLEYLITFFGGEVEASSPPQRPAPEEIMAQALREVGPAQTLIDESLADGTVAFGHPSVHGEVKGPVILRKRLVLDGKGSTLWARRGPVLLLTEDGTIVKNLQVEVTEGGDGVDEACAIMVLPGRRVFFENVEVRGSVWGIPGEEGEWHYPATLQLGLLGSRYNYSFSVEVRVPVSCEVSTSVSGLSVEPALLPAGVGMLVLHAKGGNFLNDTVLYGRLVLETPNFKRVIVIGGHVVDAELHQLQAPQPGYRKL